MDITDGPCGAGRSWRRRRWRTPRWCDSRTARSASMVRSTLASFREADRRLRARLLPGEGTGAATITGGWDQRALRGAADRSAPVRPVHPAPEPDPLRPSCCGPAMTREESTQGGTLDIAVLGTLLVRSATGDVDLGGARQRRLFAILAVDAGRVVPTADLVDRLWPAADQPRNADAALRTYLSRIAAGAGGGGRGAAGPHGAPRLSARPRRGSGSTREQLGRLVVEARRLLTTGDVIAALDAAEQALALWRGRPFAEFADEAWAAEEVERLEELHLVAREERLEALVADGQHRRRWRSSISSPTTTRCASRSPACGSSPCTGRPGRGRAAGLRGPAARAGRADRPAAEPGAATPAGTGPGRGPLAARRRDDRGHAAQLPAGPADRRGRLGGRLRSASSRRCGGGGRSR